MKLQGARRDILETIDKFGPINPFEIPDLSGWGFGSWQGTAGSTLRKNGLVEKINGEIVITELGKIALAILRGQERKRLWQDITRMNHESPAVKTAVNGQLGATAKPRLANETIRRDMTN